MLGSSTYLRFNHPQEAMKLKESSLVRLRLFIKCIIICFFAAL